MTDPWTDRLSDYLDGDLPPAERTAMETHLASCAECAETLIGIRRVITRARALDDRAPSADLWPGVAAGIGARRSPRRFSFSMPQLAAAGIALAALSGAAGWVLSPGVPAGAPTVATPGSQPLVTQVRAPTTGSYDAAVADLEQVLAAGRGQLDTATVRVLEQNLATIDRAIAQAQRAVATDSANLYLNTHLAATMRRKLELLRQAAALVAAVS